MNKYVKPIDRYIEYIIEHNGIHKCDIFQDFQKILFS